MTEEKAEWHLLRGREQAGPYPLSKMREEIAQNVLTRSSYVWRHGWPEWKLAGAVPELFEPDPAPAAPPPPPAEPQPEATASSSIADAPQPEPIASGPIAEASQPENTPAPIVEVPQPAPAPTPAITRQKPRNWIVDHWRGDLSLPKSFWINGILVSIAVQVFGLPFRVALEPIVRKIEGGEGGVSQFAASLVVGALMFTIAVAVMLWQCVGIWRSASKHGARGGNRFWSFLAKLLVVLWLLSILLALVGVGVMIAAAVLTQ